MSQTDGVGTGGAKMVLLRGSAGDGDYADGWRCKGGELDAAVYHKLTNGNSLHSSHVFPAAYSSLFP
ncbi:hypothetical protein C5167_022440 [Papaver somniferum]|uniref:Uncharacterized protein n=1 Tax=Papaver somniferum TaxID=3469 RepID=A0A4Y7JKY2_PAPSO|nr:hypothetical protein C5167_022440 [Papaver somniferum]